MPKLSVVSPVWRVEYFPDTIHTYVNQFADKDTFEVLFMVSNPDVYDEVQSCVEKNIHLGNFRVIKAFDASNCVVRNLGARLAIGEILVFSDGDQLYCSSFISEHLKLQQGYVGVGVDGVNAQTCNGELLIQQYIPAETLYYARYVSYGFLTYRKIVNFITPGQAFTFSCCINPNDKSDYANITGRNCSFYKDDFLMIGGFDEELGYSKTSISRGWEDREIGVRAFEKGLKFMHIPCYAIHPSHPRASSNDSGFLNLVKMAKKHPWLLEKRQDIFLTNNVSIERIKSAL